MTEKIKDTVNKYWMDSDNFWKRCLGVWFHYFVGALMIGLAILFVVFIFALIAGIGFGMFHDGDDYRGRMHKFDRMNNNYFERNMYMDDEDMMNSLPVQKQDIIEGEVNMQ